MGRGFIGKIAKINLTEQKIWVEEPDSKFYRKYLGGPGLSAFYLLKEIKKGVDPLGPDNVLIFAAGLITGAPGPAIPRFIVMAKSPLTGGIGKAEAGGFWGPELKKAGFDALVISGKASEPIYILISNGHVEIYPAKNLWGKTTGECQEILKAQWGPAIRVAQIGPGGENLVRYANICNELSHFNGRNGLGAVMGSKNLKAIVVKGDGDINCYDRSKVKEITRFVVQGMKYHPLAMALHEVGTPGGVATVNAAGALPTRNWSHSVFPQAEEIGDTSMEKILVGRKGCYSCPIRCKRVVAITDGDYTVEPIFGGPEYETLVSLGSNLGIADIKVLAKANELCNKYTIDTISLGMTLSFAIECYQNGLLTSEDLNGVELLYGNGELLLSLIEKIAYRKGVGNLLADGSAAIAQKIGPDGEKFLLQVKGQEIPMHDPRLKTGVGLQYALAANGADHWMAQHDPFFQEEGSLGLKAVEPLGILDAIAATDLSYRKVRLIYYTHLMTMMYDCLGACVFGMVARSILPLDKVVELVNAVTGWNTNLWELLKCGERASNMMRLFNWREGFTRKDDTLPELFFKDLREGPSAGGMAIEREAFSNALDIFYQMAGWDKKGKPTPGKLYELDLAWTLEYLDD